MVTQRARPPARPKAAKKSKAKAGKPTLWEEIVAIGARIPKEELERHPADFAEQFHHYQHGHPKRAAR